MKKLVSALLLSLVLTGSALSASFYSNSVANWSIVGQDNYCVARNTQGPITATLKVTGAFLGLKDLNFYLSNSNWVPPATGQITVEGHTLSFQKVSPTTILIAEVGNTLNDLKDKSSLTLTGTFFKTIKFNVMGSNKAIEAFAKCVDKI